MTAPTGVVVPAGQAYDLASHFSAGHLARRAAPDGMEPPLPPVRPWMDRIAALAPRRVLFAHDRAVREPGDEETATV